MSSDAFAAVSGALQRSLEAAVGAPVVLDDPGRAADGSVSLWLYHVAADEYTRNRPAPQVESAQGRAARLRLPPLGVNLFYLVAPIFDDPAMAQGRLAAVMLALYENPLLPVEAAGAEVSEVVRVALLPDTLEERAKVWEALAKPYRLSVAYQVRTVKLAPARLADGAPIVSLTAGFAEATAPGGVG